MLYYEFGETSLKVDTGFQDITRELLIDIDKTGTILNISSNCYIILGYEQSEMIGSNLMNYVCDDLGKIDFKCPDPFELSLKSKGGAIRFYDVLISPNRSDGVKISLIDISKYKIIEESEKRFRTMLENTHDVVYLYEILPEKKFVYINHATEELTGITVEEKYKDAMLPFKIVHPDDLHVQYKKINGASNFEKPFQMRMKDEISGKFIWCEDYVVPFYNDDGELKAISGFSRNIQERKELEKKLEELSYYDSLTGLFSRNYYHKQEKRLNELYDRSIGVIICDLDNLKIINDSLGHTYGDRLLIDFGNLLKREMNMDAVIARYGGDEFVILIENTSEGAVNSTYLGLQQSVEECNKRNHTMPIQVSIGWAYSPTSLGVVEKVFKIADDMMYENKFNKRKK